MKTLFAGKGLRIQTSPVKSIKVRQANLLKHYCNDIQTETVVRGGYNWINRYS